jgi:hypothetical protein
MAKGHWPFLSRNLVILVSQVTGLLGVHRGGQPGHNSCHHNHLRSRRLSHSLSLPHLCRAHGPLPSTCLGLHPDMLLVAISPCTSRVKVAWLGLVQVVVSGPCLLLLPTEMRHLCRLGCTRHLMGLPSLNRWVSSLSWWCRGGRAPARWVHLGLAAYVWRDTSRHWAGATTVVGAEGLLSVDGISPSTVVSLKLAWGRTPTMRWLISSFVFRTSYAKNT